MAYRGDIVKPPRSSFELAALGTHACLVEMFLNRVSEPGRLEGLPSLRGDVKMGGKVFGSISKVLDRRQESEQLRCVGGYRKAIPMPAWRRP